MDPYRLSVIAHIFFSILVVGLALFWVIMRVALGRRFESDEAQRHLRIAQAARWPHVGVPLEWRLPLPWLTWAVVAGLWASGFASALTGGHSQWSEWSLKWAFVAVVTVLQLFMTHRVRPGLFNLQLALLLATIAISAWLTRYA
jgi:hypothetical protein